ncbi:capsular polysaccharide export protein, LipB/KpsS family [Sphingomonas daechungensis]|uniref:capsular polysaccharide export protein, LipB/KpsS family n=1 Tax=Sphingomonas daechungensis TaxID=1176646 RepID=UPI0021D52263|nr:hypothetical protein [Sphingomonas daechungensis]
MAQRSFVFLQGPPGPFFQLLGAEMAKQGAEVHRINLSGGDALDWPEGAVNFRGRFSEWPVFFDDFLRRNGITDLLLYGDCRPYHLAAHGVAALRDVRTHVLEEGYLRPHWMTLEREGVNARSPLSRDKSWFFREAATLPPEPDLPPVTASFKRRARDSYWYYHHVLQRRFSFPHYRSHRSTPILKEGFGWLWKFWREKRASRHATQVLGELEGQPKFLLPYSYQGISKFERTRRSRTCRALPAMSSRASRPMRRRTFISS